MWSGTAPQGDWMQRATAVHKMIASCDQKAVYRTRGRALIAAQRLPFASKPYRCQICGDWHLTSKI